MTWFEIRMALKPLEESAIARGRDLRMEANVCTMRIARKLSECEEGADRLLANTAGLISEMVNARLESDFAFGTGQRAFVRIADAQKALLNAQSDLMRAHADLRKIAEERGGIWTGDCPPATGALSEAA